MAKSLFFLGHPVYDDLNFRLKAPVSAEMKEMALLNEVPVTSWVLRKLSKMAFKSITQNISYVLLASVRLLRKG